VAWRAVEWLRGRNTRFLRLVGRAIPLAAQSLYVGWGDPLSPAFRPKTARSDRRKPISRRFSPSVRASL
jgi:hypothetical protein